MPPARKSVFIVIVGSGKWLGSWLSAKEGGWWLLAVEVDGLWLWG